MTLLFAASISSAACRTQVCCFSRPWSGKQGEDHERSDVATKGCAKAAKDIQWCCCHVYLCVASDCLWLSELQRQVVKDLPSPGLLPARRDGGRSCLDIGRLHSNLWDVRPWLGPRHLKKYFAAHCAFYPVNLGSSTHRYKLIQTRLPFWLRHDMTRHGTTVEINCSFAMTCKATKASQSFTFWQLKSLKDMPADQTEAIRRNKFLLAILVQTSGHTKDRLDRAVVWRRGLLRSVAVMSLAFSRWS